jgi:hypothetical protein
MESMMRKLLALIMIAGLVLMPHPSFAAVGIWKDGSPQGTATDIEFSGAGWTNNGSRWTFPLVMAGTASGGSTSMTTTDTAVSVSYALVKKQIGIQVGLAGTLAGGTDGQILTILITARAGSGTFVLTPTTKTGYASITFDAAGEFATLMYVNSTVGWIILSTTATLNTPS